MQEAGEPGPGIQIRREQGGRTKLLLQVGPGLCPSIPGAEPQAPVFQQPRSSVATLQQIPMSIEEAAISLGSSKMKAFFKVTMPMMANGIISGALLSWIAIITELSTGILLYNWRTTTLTIQIYTYVSRGSYGVAAAMACVLTVMTTISLLIFIKFSKNKNITF